MAWIVTSKRKTQGRQVVSYSIAWREHGRVRSRSLGRVSKPEARRALVIFEGRVAAGLPLEPPTASPTSHETSSAPTMSEFLEAVFLPVVARDKAASTHRINKTCAKSVKAFMGRCPVDEVDFALVDRYVTHRRRTVRSRTVQLELRLIRQSLDHARKLGLLAAVPEIPKVRDTDRRPHRWLNEEETARLLEALHPLESQPDVTRGNPPVNRDRLSYLAVLLAVNLGLRRGEILSRGWEDLRWTMGPHGTLVIGPKPSIGFDVKTRRSRAIPLTPQVHEELLDLHAAAGRPRSGWIFPSPRDSSKPRKNFIHALRRACRTAGLPHIHPHGLRHTWASRLAASGVDRRTLMELGGWKDSRILDEIYSHVSDDHKWSVMASSGVGR